MNIKLAKALKLITIFTLIVSLTMSMTGCGTLQQDMQPTDTTTTPNLTEPADPNAIVSSNGGYFEGVRYNELPTINHRTEEEISATGLTAQDVLNAYDQLVTDISKARYSDGYNFMPQEIRESVVAKFESISTWRFEFYNTNTDLYEFTACPFYAFHPNYYPGVNFNAHFSSSIPEIPAYVITLSMKCYIDGVIRDEFLTVGVEENQFEQTMTAFGKKSFFLEHDTFMEKLEKVDDYNDFSQFYNQKAYEPITISRETILNATPEQLKAIYTMISSIRSIGFEYKLP
ncbi:MAG: hypothetical protein IKW45_02520 [Clostridia bacterium]|nr:hypothetical protein [Clostridia bacterium]